MANTHTTLSALFTATADAIRSKTGNSAAIVADQFPDAIGEIEVKENLDAEISKQDSLIAQINTALASKVGKELPALSNPAGAANIEAGYQAIDGAGNLVEGTKKMVVGSKAVTQNTSITISELARAENFILALASNIPKGSQYRFVTSVIKTGSTLKTYSPSSYYVVDDYSSYMTFDSATGKFTGTNLYFGSSTYSYVAW